MQRGLCFAAPSCRIQLTPRRSQSFCEQAFGFAPGSGRYGPKSELYGANVGGNVREPSIISFFYLVLICRVGDICLLGTHWNVHKYTSSST
ncbi:unnamed protein product [Amoebophrya sp. A25]|nr:unnamed protein product [Amoebophrya sp. A25]|eukprot:GSA25T00015103001.1